MLNIESIKIFGKHRANNNNKLFTSKFSFSSPYGKCYCSLSFAVYFINATNYYCQLNKKVATINNTFHEFCLIKYNVHIWYTCTTVSHYSDTLVIQLGTFVSIT